MKLVIVVLISILFGSFSQAQTIAYQTLYGNNTNYGYITQYWNGAEVITYHTKTVWGRDTLIGSENYVQIYKWGQYAGGIREDVANQQRYFIGTDNIEKNITISHFLHVGDYLTDSSVFLNAFRAYFDFSAIDYDSPDSLVVGQIDSILEANGTYSCSYWLAKPGQIGYYLFRYNTYRGLLNLDRLENHTYQYCYGEIDSLGTVPNPTQSPCDLGLEELKSYDIVVSPNPTSDMIEISGKDVSLVHDITIYNLHGLMVRKVLPSEINSGISLQELESGVYLLAVNGNARVLRLIKQ